MTKIKDLIKNELCETFKPRFQSLNKGLGVAPAGGGDGMGPPKAKMPPMMPKQKKPASQTPPTAAPKAPKAPTAPKAPGASMPKVAGKQVGGGFNKEEKGTSQAKFHIHQDGHKITDESETLSEIHKKHGKDIESKGFVLVEDKVKKSEIIKSEVMGGYRPVFLGNIKDLAKTSPLLAIASVPYASLSKAGTQHIIAGVHVPNEVAPPPKSKKVKGNKDQGSGGQITHKEEIPANKVIKPVDSLEKDVVSMTTGKKINATKERVENQGTPDIAAARKENIKRMNKPPLQNKQPAKNKDQAIADGMRDREEERREGVAMDAKHSSSGVSHKTSEKNKADERKRKNADIIRRMKSGTFKGRRS